jgi:type 1 glutamine amidotransferase
VIYSALGHTDESWSEPYMISLMTGALAWAAGK